MANSDKPAPAPASGKRVQLENNTRAIYHLPSAKTGVGYVVLGDKLDTDDRVPPGRERDPKRQPSPKVVMTSAEYAEHGPTFDKVVGDLVKQGFIRRTELAA